MYIHEALTTCSYVFLTDQIGYLNFTLGICFKVIYDFNC